MTQRGDMNELLTEKVRRIPYAVAAKLAHPRTEQHEEIVSLGNSVLVRAAQNYVPGRLGNNGKPASFPTYALRCVSLKVRSLLAIEAEFLRRQRGLRRGEAVEHDWGKSDAKEVWEFCRRSLTAKEIRLVKLHFWDGLSANAIIKMGIRDYGHHHPQVSLNINRVLDKLRSALGVIDDTDGVHHPRRGKVRQDQDRPAEPRPRQPQLD